MAKIVKGDVKPCRGLGDAVKVVTEYLGIEQCEKCKERQVALNKFFPFLKLTQRILTDEEMILIETGSDEELHKLYCDVYGLTLSFCDTCTRIKSEIKEKLEVQMNAQQQIYSLR